MEENKIFYIENNGKKLKATILTNFEMLGEHYCIYTIPIENSKNSNVYCAKLVNNNLIEITSEEEKRLTSKVVTKLIS